MNIGVIFAGGKGVRMGAGLPKQFLEINGKPIIIHTIQLFEYHAEIDRIYISVLEDYIPYMQELIEEYRIRKVGAIVEGGETTQDSIYNALKAIERDNNENPVVLIHDGVRPFVSYEVITKNIQSVKSKGNAITCIPCSETILLSRNGETVENVPYRKETHVAQAPQSFYLKDIIAAHDVVRSRPDGYENMVDACTIIRSLGIDANMITGNRGNIKVTTPEDVYLFRALLQYKENEQAFGLGLTDLIETRINKAKTKNAEDI
ncbi:MAG: 2-C-methyl-D-erythritol 4-phosphate cytidylyltransferase [Oscillospiraceae bacterium]|nr:2-C-methyl-D-erythritol 4-phosphate cytidylyltransferase [Oscillospiraceae bacterium]